MYIYRSNREQIFTDKGQKTFLIIKDRVKRLLKAAGAFNLYHAIEGVSGNPWDRIACIDRLKELKEITEVYPKDSWTIARIFINRKMKL